MTPMSALRAVFFALLLAAVTPLTALAGTSACMPHIEAAERHYRMPQGLLLAVALTESGYRGLPHPWTLNVKGRPVYLDDGVTARRVLRAEARQTDRIAVGCMQIFLRYHAFKDPVLILNPKNNVWYGARFLARLRAEHGSWTKAVARYHAGEQNVSAQRTYVCQVLKNYEEIRGLRRVIKGPC